MAPELHAGFVFSDAGEFRSTA